MNQRVILEKLASYHPRMAPELRLWEDVRREYPEITLAMLRLDLVELQRKNQVVVITTEDATRIKITPDGLARLSE